MASNISYIALLQTIELFASSHLQIKMFASDFPSELPNLSNVDEKYPVLFVSPTSSVFDVNATTFNIDVYCYDLIEKDRSNINTILSDTNLILNDLKKWLTDGDLAGLEVIETATATPINNSLLDYAAGWVCSFQVDMGTYDICQIPFSTFPIVSGICNSITYLNVLTCDNLDECQTFIDVANRPDVYVTGGTFDSETSDITFTNTTGGTFVVTGITGGGGGTPIFFDWRFDASTVSGDPGTGDFRFDNTVGSAITRVYIDSINSNGDDMDYYFTKIVANQWNLYVQQKDDDTKRGQFEVTGTPINNGGWWSIGVQYLDSTGIPPQNNKVCNLAFQKTSDADLPFVNTATTLNINGNAYDLSTDREWRTAQADTGALIYGGAVYNSSTTIDIGAVDGYIVNNETNPLVPSYTRVTYTGNTNVTVPTLSSGTATYVLLQSDGTIHFQNTFPTSSERKAKIYLSKIGHPQGLITLVLDEVDFITSPLMQFRDVFQALVYINLGIQPYANTGLTINTTGGSVIGDGINFVTDNTNPNTLSVAATSPTSFVYRNQTGGTETGTTILDPTMYDASGVTTSVPTGYTTIQYVFFAPGGGFAIQRGQNLYSAFTEAIQGVGRETFNIFDNFEQNAVLVGVIVMAQDGTDVTDTTKFRFLKADKFGQVVGSSSSQGVTTLQGAYNNSSSPQIQLDSGKSALKIQGYSPSGSTTFEALNSIGDTVFSITEAGVFSGVSMVRTITTTNTRGIDITLQNTGTTSNGIFLTNNNNSGNASIARIINNSGGTGVFLTNNGTGRGMLINASTGNGSVSLGGGNIQPSTAHITGGANFPSLSVDSTNYGVQVNMNASATHPAIRIDSNLTSTSSIVFENFTAGIGPTIRMDRSGAITGTSFTKSGGTSSQFLKADGSTSVLADNINFVRVNTANSPNVWSATTAMQKMINLISSPDEFNAEADTTYRYKVFMSNENPMTAGSATFSFGFLGTCSATIQGVSTAIRAASVDVTPSAAYLNITLGGFPIGLAQVVTLASTAAIVMITVEGIIEIGTAGTIYPAISCTNAGVISSAGRPAIGSHFIIEKIGSRLSGSHNMI